MLQIVGLIVAVYAMARLVQVPMEMSCGPTETVSIPYWARLAVVAIVSILGLLAVFILTIGLFKTASPGLPH